jgi:hypothetical protein
VSHDSDNNGQAEGFLMTTMDRLKDFFGDRII